MVEKKVKTEAKEFVLKMAREHNVKFVELWFTDILGMLKSYAIPVSELESAIDNGMGFDVRNQAGNGYGLSTIRQRCDLNGCSIEVESREGSGTRVTVTAAVRVAETGIQRRAVSRWHWPPAQDN